MLLRTEVNLALMRLLVKWEEEKPSLPEDLVGGRASECSDGGLLSPKSQAMGCSWCQQEAFLHILTAELAVKGLGPGGKTG